MGELGRTDPTNSNEADNSNVTNTDMIKTSSQRCLKRLLEEPPDNVAKRKPAPQVPHPPTTGLSPFPGTRNPSPKSSQSKAPSRVGQYTLVERYEGEEVYRAEHSQTKKQFTCQVLSLHSYQDFLIAYNRIGQHESICSLLDTVICGDRAYVFLSGHYGDMHTYVRRWKRLSEDEIRHLFTQVLNAVSHCHQHGVILRDLKLRKFVFTDKNRTRLALLTLNDCTILYGNHGDDSLTDRHGCPAYVSPELLTNGKGSYSGRAADIWSLGVCLYTMLVGRYPFQEMQPAALFAKIRHGAFSLPEWLSPQAKCLIGCMLRKSPAERLKASELLMHPWLTSPSRPHRSTHKTQRSSQQVLQIKQEDNQVVPTWTEKAQ